MWVGGSALRACAPVAVGEPRNIADPANRPFMESITKGECPAELDPGSRSQQVSVNLVRSEKPYEAPPKPKYKAFCGSGQTLAGGVCSTLSLSAPGAQYSYVAADLDVMTKSCVDCLLYQLQHPSCCNDRTRP